MVPSSPALARREHRCDSAPFSSSSSKVYSDLDLGMALSLKHSSVWLRSSAGYSPGDRDEPFANFYFGGFGNNWVDHRGQPTRHEGMVSLKILR